MKFNIKHLEFKKISIAILTMLIPTLLNLNTMNAFAGNLNLAEKIKSAEKNIVWSDKKYERYHNFGETIVGGRDDESGKFVKLIFMDKTLKKILNSKYIDREKYDSFIDSSYELVSVDGLILIKKYGKYGIVDETGKEVIECKYDEIKDYKEGLLTVKL